MRNTMTFQIDAPVDRVFDFCADFSTTVPVISPGSEVTQASSGPLGVGSVFLFAHPTGLKGRAEVVQYSPPHTLKVATDWGNGPFTTVTLVGVAEGGGSLVRVYNDAKPMTRFRWMQPIAWVFAPFARGIEAKANDRYVEYARKTLEAGPPGDGGGVPT